MDTNLLYRIALVQESMLGYIPDPTNVGTTFVNGISNILTTAAIDVRLHLGKTLLPNIQDFKIGDFSRVNDEIYLGSIRYG